VTVKSLVYNKTRDFVYLVLMVGDFYSGCCKVAVVNIHKYLLLLARDLLNRISVLLFQVYTYLGENIKRRPPPGAPRKIKTSPIKSWSCLAIPCLVWFVPLFR
jgi:hypothetical protein